MLHCIIIALTATRSSSQANDKHIKHIRDLDDFLWTLLCATWRPENDKQRLHHNTTDVHAEHDKEKKNSDQVSNAKAFIERQHVNRHMSLTAAKKLEIPLYLIADQGLLSLLDQKHKPPSQITKRRQLTVQDLQHKSKTYRQNCVRKTSKGHVQQYNTATRTGQTISHLTRADSKKTARNKTDSDLRTSYKMITDIKVLVANSSKPGSAMA
jgi:hypothetical protein